MFAVSAGIPVASSAGKAIRVPPPAAAFTAPASRPAAATSPPSAGLTAPSASGQEVLRPSQYTRSVHPLR